MTPRAKAKPKKAPTPEVLSWSTTTRKILDLIPYDSNPRQMSTKQVEDLTASLTKFNFVEIPAVNLNNTILAGHQRLKIMALLNRGDEEIDVRIPSRQLTADEEKEYLIRSNRNTGDWDFDILANEFDMPDLLAWGFDSEQLGAFDVGEIDPPELEDGDRDGFQSMTFTLCDAQVLEVQNAIGKAKQVGPFNGTGNENSNGNALARIAEAFTSG